MAGETQSRTSTFRECTLGSSTGLLKVGGDLIAVPHKVPKTGYKAPNAYGAKPVFMGETTNKTFQKSIKTVDQCSSTTKKLMPYYPNASRNRPKDTMENTVGNRFGPHPSCKTEKYRGESHLNLKSKDPCTTRPWQTTNQVFQEATMMRDPVGLSNAGISSDIAKRTHKKQGIYE